MIFAKFGRDPRLESALQGLGEVQIDPLELPAAGADRRRPVYQVSERRLFTRPDDGRLRNPLGKNQSPPGFRKQDRVSPGVRALELADHKLDVVRL